MKQDLIYVGSPYSHRNAAVRLERLTAVQNICYTMFTSGLTPISPVTIWGPLDLQGSKFRHEDLMTYCINILSACSMLLVITLNGWEISDGLYQEVEYARENKIPVRYSSAKEIYYTIEELKNGEQ